MSYWAAKIYIFSIQLPEKLLIKKTKSLTINLVAIRPILYGKKYGLRYQLKYYFYFLLWYYYIGAICSKIINNNRVSEHKINFIYWQKIIKN